MTDDDLIRRGDALAIVVRDRVPTNRTGSEFRVVLPLEQPRNGQAGQPKAQRA